MLSLLHILSYVAAVVAFVFVTFSLANGLLWLAELIEEHSRIAKTVGIRAIYVIIALHLALYFSERFPLRLIAFSIFCHIVYLQNFSSSWPVISLLSPSFIFSCLLVIADHFLWFFHFARVTQEARRLAQTQYHRGGRLITPAEGVHTFWEISTFFGVCVWALPLFLFLSLSANDNALPTSNGPSTPSHSRTSFEIPAAQRERSSLFKKALSFVYWPLGKKGKPEPLIAPPRSPLLSPALVPLPSTPSNGAFGSSDMGYPRTPSPRKQFLNAVEGSGIGARMSLQAPPRRHATSPAASPTTPRTRTFGGSDQPLEPPENEDRTGLGLRVGSGSGSLAKRRTLADLFLGLVTASSLVGNVFPSASKLHGVSRIHEVAFFSLFSSTYDSMITMGDIPPSPNFPDSVDIVVRENPYASPQAPVEHPCAPVMKVLTTGNFYFTPSPQWDLSTRLAVRLRSQDQHDPGLYDDRFIWNEYLARPLIDFRERLDVFEKEEFDRCQFNLLVIQGYVGISKMALPAPPTNGSPAVATLCIISRLSCKRAGTRFNTRGVDDDGNCANFVETEIIFSSEDLCFSYVQVRGSVPLFWEQQGIQTFGQRIQITRPQRASQPAFDLHFHQLEEEYSAIHAVNLLGTKENEAILSAAYKAHLEAAIVAGAVHDVGLSNFDFHQQVRIGGHDSVVRELKNLPGVREGIDQFGFTTCDLSLQEVVIDQKGVFRVNCLDCLDRTNFVQDLLGRILLETFLVHTRREWIYSDTLWTQHRELWAENGDALSKIYAGTGAINTSYTRTGKRTLAGESQYFSAYINNFQDKGKQVAIDMFLGNLSSQHPTTIFDPVHDTVSAVLKARVSEYSTVRNSTIFVGTWNLNGRHPSESLVPWLWPGSSSPDPPDLFAIGFQEIVPLTAQQIVQTDTTKKDMWEKQIMNALAQKPGKPIDYVVLRSEQLVGTALFIIVKTSLLSVIRNVEATTRKTGLRGMSGNKGAVGIRLDYYDTSFCFITAHLAAGHANVDERNKDYQTISQGLHFLRGKTINSHDQVIWLADTNYRIDLDNDTVREQATSADFDALLGADQLKEAMQSGAAFDGYLEGPILFKPTYRFDLFSDNYDTSEKMRIPAWTDRVLYRGEGLDVTVYACANLKSSDHRPVYALFRSPIRIVDGVKRDALSRIMLDTILSRKPGEKLEDKLAKVALEELVDLPPPSSEKNAWWDQPEHPGGVFSINIETPNRHAPKNPWDSPSSIPITSPSSSDEDLYSATRLEPVPDIDVEATDSTKKSPPPIPRETKPKPKPGLQRDMKQ
ncbi:phosphatidylinositol phosphate phosphatase [Sistotremastrum suecicum HHB10207 ss-3]|uniref:phosphoinositide 5-phosphatase n=1 Tax=Sistotremastrum suecicum HHB10207 ss-3 TaxID=1314776 RepID=A0A166HR26_9AGAM|nr:phosphatidylinositol phosphate phosphatase [Sistotremastrum suecicum HHB10207 ss-3]